MPTKKKSTSSGKVSPRQPPKSKKTTKQVSSTSTTKSKVVTKGLSPEAQSKGQIALMKWRQEQKRLKEAKANGESIPEETKAPGKITPLRAIKAFCLSCVGDSRRDITNCTSRQCPLYPVRPYQKKGEPD